MATTLKRLSLQARCNAFRTPYRSRKLVATPSPWQRSFSSTRPYFDEDDKNQTASRNPAKFEDLLDADDKAYYQSLSPEERKQMESEGEIIRNHFSSESVQERWEEDIEAMVDEIEEEFPEEPDRPMREAPGYWNMGEENDEVGEDEEFQNDDISSLGHGELEQHRELREYARIAAWEMPLLSKLARPFEPPTEGRPLRFRYTTYMGEQHPASRKVVVEFSPSDLPDLTAQQRDKLIKLAGTRYNPSTEIVKMSCEMFETQAQNKRYLGDLVETLLQEARDATDTFADVPFDFRHHKPKQRHEFPKEWLLTPERQQYLEQRRRERLQLDERRVMEGTRVDGVSIIEKALAAPATQAVPLMVEANPAGGARERRQLLRRR